MMKCKPVYAWLEMAQDDDVLIDPDDINHEAINNMWSFSPTEDETPQIHAADIVEFVGELIAARSSALVGDDGDEQEAAPFVLPVFVVPVPLYSARQEARGPAGLQG